MYPAVGVEAGGVPAVGPAGAGLLTGTVRAVGLDVGLSGALAPWRRPLAVHDPGKIIVDLALCAALGGRALVRRCTAMCLTVRCWSLCVC